MHGRRVRYLNEELLHLLLFYILIPFFAIFLLVDGIFLFYISSTIRNNLDMQFQQLCASISKTVSNTKYATASFMTNEGYLRSLSTSSNEEALPYDVFVARNNLNQSIKDLKYVVFHHQDSQVFLLEKERLYDGMLQYAVGDYSTEAWYHGVQENSTYFFPLEEQHMRSLCSSSKDNYLLEAQQIKRYRGEVLGYMFYRISLDAFFDDISAPNYREGQLAITDKNGRLLAQTEGLGEEFLSQADGIYKGKFLQSGEIADSGLTLHYQGEADRLFQLPLLSIVLFLIVFVLSTIAAVFLCTRISNHISRPIVHLRDRMETIEVEGHEAVADMEVDFVEVEELEKSFINAEERIQSLLASIQKRVEERDQAYYNSLQAQIRPHFLFNTLNAIHWKAKLNEDQDVADSLAALSVFLRNLYHNDCQYNTLDEEMLFLDNYVKVVNIRFDNRIRFYHILSEGLGDYLVPRFCLQPLVENSFFHGFVGKKDGMIVLKVTEEGQSLQFSLSDNGVGLQGKEIDMEEAVDKHRATGIGLSNIQDRLKHLYGDACSFVVDAGSALGFHVTITIPKQKKEDVQ